MSERSREAEADRQVNADNLRHFGEPVYEYDMGQGIEDGYLAACEIVRRDIFLDDKPRERARDRCRRRRPRGQGAPRTRDTGEAVGWAEARARYEAAAFEDRLLLPERVAAMTRDLFDHLLATGGPEQKTIMFCARDRHADDVATALNNLYATWCAAEGRPRLEPYAFKCTAAAGGQDYLADLRGASRITSSPPRSICSPPAWTYPASATSSSSSTSARRSPSTRWSAGARALIRPPAS